ncbi:MAG TPA: hypothetical protein PKC43_10275, partial [Phycisphaerales bacterium]|nr:hypothetical protein [Phycisphaerales bacterium]
MRLRFFADVPLNVDVDVAASVVVPLPPIVPVVQFNPPVTVTGPLPPSVPPEIVRFVSVKSCAVVVVPAVTVKVPPTLSVVAVKLFVPDSVALPPMATGALKVRVPVSPPKRFPAPEIVAPASSVCVAPSDSVVDAATMNGPEWTT